MINTVILDLDGTLYEDARVYEHHVRELASRLPMDRGEALLRDWERARRGELSVRVGLGYDAERDELFRHDGERIQDYLTWEGEVRPVPPPPPPDPATPHPPTDLPVFGPTRYNIGDLWGLSLALAAHHGITRSMAEEAFLSTRAWMDADAFGLLIDSAWLDTVRALHRRGIRTVVFSNSFTETVQKTIDNLHIRDDVDEIIGSAGKPAGMIQYLDTLGPGPHILSVGDNYVNDILPAIRVECHALFIDRYDTHLGANNPLCTRVTSIDAAREWVERRVLGRAVEA